MFNRIKANGKVICCLGFRFESKVREKMHGNGVKVQKNGIINA